MSRDQSSTSLADESSFASSSYASSSRASRVKSPAMASLRDPMQTPRPSTLKPRPVARDASLSMSIGNMSSEQTNQSVLLDAALPTMDFTAAFPSPRRKGNVSEDVQPTPRPVKRTSEATRVGTEETPQRLLPPGKQSPGSKVSGGVGSDAAQAQANVADGSFSINESLWRSEGQRFLKRYQEVEQEEQQQQQRQSVEPLQDEETVASNLTSTSVVKHSPQHSTTQDRSLLSWTETKTPKPASRTSRYLTSPNQSTEERSSIGWSPRRAEDRSENNASPQTETTGLSADEQETSVDKSAREAKESVTEAADESHGDAEGSLWSEKEVEASFSTPGAIERSISYSHASLRSSPNEKSPDSFSSLRSRRPMTPSSAQGPSPSNLSFSTARDHESSPAAAKLERKGAPQLLQDLVPPAPMPGARQPPRVEKVEPSQEMDKEDRNAAVVLLHASSTTTLSAPVHQMPSETDEAEADALHRLSAVRSALEEFTTAQSLRLGTLSIRLEQDQSEAARLRSLLSNELQSRVALLDEVTGTKLELDRLREESERVKAEREQERLWVGQRDEELRSLVRKLEQQLERRFSASTSSARQADSGQDVQAQELKAELERERQARAVERRDLEIRLAAATSSTFPASPNAKAEVGTNDIALFDQKALEEAVHRARESIERDHEVKIYRMEREHEEALEALQDQLDRAEADRSGASGEQESKQVASLEAEIARLERILQESTDAGDSRAHTSIDKSGASAKDLAKLRIEKEEAERLAGQRLQIINDLQGDIGRFHGERATNARQLDSLKDAAQAVDAEVVQPLKTEVAALEASVKRLQGEKAAAEGQHQQSAEGFEHEIAQSEEERERAEFLLQESQVEKKNLEGEMQALKETMAELESESSEQVQRIGELEQELAATREELDSSLVTASSSRTSLEAQVRSLQQALELANTTKSSIQTRLVAVEGEVKTLTARNEVLAREASDSDMKRLKLQKANEVLYAEYEKIGIALETKQLEVEMLKRKVRKPELAGEGQKEGTATAVEALKAKRASDIVAADRDAEESSAAEVLLEKGPNPLRARGRKTIDPWAQQQAARAVREGENDNGRTPTAATSRTGTAVSSTRTSLTATKTHQPSEASARRLSSRAAMDKPRSVLGPSAVGNTSHTRASRISRVTKYSVDLSETDEQLEASESQIKETTARPGSVAATVGASAATRRGSTSSLSSNLTAASVSSTSSRSKHSVHDSRSLTGAMAMRRGSATSVTSQSRDEPMSLDELRSELGASGSANARARLKSSHVSSSSLASRSLATRSISISQPSYSQSQSQSQSQSYSMQRHRQREREGHGSEAGSEMMDLVESDVDAEGQTDQEVDEDVDEEEGGTGQTTPTSRSHQTRVSASMSGMAQREDEDEETAGTLPSLREREKRLHATELRVPRSLLASARSNRRREEERAY